MIKLLRFYGLAPDPDMKIFLFIFTYKTLPCNAFKQIINIILFLNLTFLKLKSEFIVSSESQQKGKAMVKLGEEG